MTNNELKELMKKEISNLESGKEFFLRDIIPNPPAHLGHILYDEVNDGNISNVEFIGIIDDVAKYKKL